MPKFTTLSLNLFYRTNKILLLSLLSLCCSSIYAQTHSFSGTIGKYPVYFQMTIAGSEVVGYYFYKNKLIDLPLSGTFKAGKITLKTSEEYSAATEPETFQFKWPNKAIEGTWSQKGKSLPFKLVPLTAKETGSPKCSNPHLSRLEQGDELVKVKIGLFKLKEVDTVETINHIKIRYFEEVNSKITLFRIDSGLVADKQKDANSYLESIHIMEFLGSYGCASYSTYGSDFNYSAYNISLSTDFMCFTVFKTYYCGGAHPDEENYGINYNLNAKQRLPLTEYLIPDKETAFEERVYASLSKIAPEYFKEGESDDIGCEYFKKELWTVECGFEFTPEGLKFLPVFYHFDAPCLEPNWAVVPYSDLKDFIKPEYYSKLNRLKP